MFDAAMFVLLPVLYIGSMLVVTALVVLALWRGMRAQEEIARSLRRLEVLLSVRERRG